MAYFAPYVDATGLHVPAYGDIYDYEIQQFQSVYGQTISTTDDSADIQWISIFALMINDAMQTAQLAVNARSPSTAIGSDLDAIVKINGIARKPSSYSTVALTLSGIAGTVLNNKTAQDTSGNLWALPVSVTIPNSGTLTVTATCRTVGAITAAPNSITIITQPTKGWTGVTNPAGAVVGQSTEADSQLRARQAVSVALPSRTMVAGTLAGIAAITGVTRYNPGAQTPGATQGTSVENPTGANDSWGNPPHSISMVVEGGTDLAIATAIYNNKTPGCFTNGTTTVAVTDPISGATMNISFFRPTYVPIYVTLTVKELNGYTSATTAAIQNAVTAYLNSLQIGESLTISALYGAALSVMPNLSLPLFSITDLTAGTAQGSQATTDIAILFNQVTQGVLLNVTVNAA